MHMLIISDIVVLGSVEASDIPPNRLTAALARSLASQVLLEAGNLMRDSREIVVLCRELVTSSKSDNYALTIYAINALAEVVNSRSRIREQDQPLDEVIEFLRGVLEECPPGLHRISLALGSALSIRFCMTHSNDDCEESTAILDMIIASVPPGP
jgi:hypothetical protein